MGCKDSRELAPRFQVRLTRTSIRALDDFYDEVERLVSSVQHLKESIDIVIDKFEVVTGLCDSPRANLAIGILAFLIHLLAESGGYTSSIEIHISDSIPGLILTESTLSRQQAIVYHSWVELLEFLEFGVEHLQEVAPTMAKYLQLAKTLPEKSIPVPQNSDFRAIDYRKLEKATGDNFQKIKTACEMLAVLLASLKRYVQESVNTVVEIGRSQDLSPLLRLSRRARKRHLETVPEILREFWFDLDKMIKSHRAPAESVDSPAESTRRSG